LPRLHAVTDERVAGRDDLNDVAAALVRGGGPDLALHARGHTLSGRAHYELARTLGRHAPARLFVNDRLDVALACGATGVQLAWTRWAPAEARALDPVWWIGCAVHDRDEAAAARTAGADYLLLGPMFPTPTHPGRRPLDPVELGAVVALGLPVIAVGGIECRHAASLAEAGLHGVAAIRALWDAPDPSAAARAFVEAWT
jgi:thiazole tautomerase (transcriptional regulator TenI)